MSKQTQTIIARSGVAAILLVGITACAPEEFEPTDDRAAAIEQQDLVDSVSAEELDIEGRVYADDLDSDNLGDVRPIDMPVPASVLEADSIQMPIPGVSNESESEVMASSNSLQADFNGDGYADLAIGVPGEDLGSALPDAGAVNVIYGSASGLTSIGDQLWTQNSPGVLGVSESDDNFGWTLAAGDFDGDGYADLAIASPFEGVGSADRAGAVNILYGSASGLTASGDQLLHQNIVGMLDMAETNDLMGLSMTSGDFDGDGYYDLAMGVPYEDLAGRPDVGAVNVVYGSSSGLTVVAGDFWHQDVPGVDGLMESGDLFGSALAAGDFDGDGRHDLAIGVPREDLGSLMDAGSVNVLIGSDSGLTGEGDQSWHQDTSGIKGVAEAGDRFGQSLTTGDFDDDGRADLVVGVPYEDVGAIMDAGAINAIYGTSDGLDSPNDQYLHQNTFGIKDEAETFDLFGLVLTAGDFDGDDNDDLAVGVPAEDIEGATTATNAGIINVLLGSSDGITTPGDQVLSQDTPGILGVSESFDIFAAALTAGDFDGDGYTDLAAGTPLEDLGSLIDAGVVNVMYGASSGLTSAGDQLWHQNIAGILGVAESGDRFGSSVR